MLKRILPGVARFTLLLAILGTSPVAAQSPVWTPPFTDGSGSTFCENEFLAAGLSCYGRYCDDMEMLCRYFAPDSAGPSTWEWLPPISEEAGRKEIPAAEGAPLQVIQGMKCEGDFCDDISVRLFIFPEVPARSCRQIHPALSEERQVFNVAGHDSWFSVGPRGQIRASCDAGYWLSGLTCEGSYCDNLTLTCCRY